MLSAYRRHNLDLFQHTIIFIMMSDNGEPNGVGLFLLQSDVVEPGASVRIDGDGDDDVFCGGFEVYFCLCNDCCD